MQLSAAVYLLLLASSAQGLIFRWNFAEIPVFFVFAVNRKKKFRYFSVYFISKFKKSKKIVKKYDKKTRCFYERVALEIIEQYVDLVG